MAKRLEELLKKEVYKVDECADAKISEDKRIVFLENPRFYPGEKANDPEFAKKLASFADIYVNDAFSNSHRDQASMTGIPKYIPGCYGYLIKKEIEALDLSKAEKPLIAILGGKKLETRFDLINELLTKVDKVLLGGAMIFNFYKEKGYEIGTSFYENDPDILLKAKMLMNNEKIVIPTDVVVTKEDNFDNLSEKSEAKTVSADKIEQGYMGLDIGQDSVDEFELAMADAKTIVWNGPMGYFELPQFSKATDALVKYLANCGKKVIVGGGDTASAVDRLGLVDKFYHVSTGGGASMMYLSGKTLPALKALDDNEVEFFDVKKKE